jgi:preprotein translocase subunit SecB
MLAHRPDLRAKTGRRPPFQSKKGSIMAETEGQPAAAPATGAQPNLGVVAQYVKDLSFENPGAPATLRNRSGQPNINISIAVHTNTVATNEYEVELKLDARAVDGQAVLFAVELVYAGVFRFANVPPEAVAPLAMIECPRLLFPFARQIIADASRNGGYPPLMIDTVDFAAMYRQQMQNAAGAGAPAQAAPN